MFGERGEAGKELGIGQGRGGGIEIEKVRGEGDFGFCTGERFGYTGV